MQKVIVLTGAGISAESGIRTFRDAGGIWEQHRIEDVATPKAWQHDPEMVLRFYNQRRQQLLQVQPNAGHRALVELERSYDVQIITQNVDDLHERAGSRKVLHLHGELRKARSERLDHLVYDWDGDIQLGDRCESGHQLRPHIVWFGEAVPLMETAVELVQTADIFIIIGTSLQVYPAAGLMAYARRQISYFYIDPNPQLNWELQRLPNLTVIAEPAASGVPELVEELLS